MAPIPSAYDFLKRDFYRTYPQASQSDFIAYLLGVWDGPADSARNDDESEPKE